MEIREKHISLFLFYPWCIWRFIAFFCKHHLVCSYMHQLLFNNKISTSVFYINCACVLFMLGAELNHMGEQKSVIYLSREIFLYKQALPRRAEMFGMNCCLKIHASSFEYLFQFWYSHMLPVTILGFNFVKIWKQKYDKNGIFNHHRNCHFQSYLSYEWWYAKFASLFANKPSVYVMSRYMYGGWIGPKNRNQYSTFH